MRLRVRARVGFGDVCVQLVQHPTTRPSEVDDEAEGESEGRGEGKWAMSVWKVCASFNTLPASRNATLIL